MSNSTIPLWIAVIFLVSATLPGSIAEECDEETETENQCECRTPSNDKRIIGGQTADLHEYPFQVFLKSIYVMSRGRHRKRYSEICGGTLISSQWVLTAAQCVTHGKARGVIPSVRVRVGANNIGKSSMTPGAKSYRSHDIIIHPDFNNDPKTTVHNDIALIKLNRAVEISDSVRPACLPVNYMKDAIFNGDVGTSLGWGRTNSKSPVEVSKDLKEVNLYIYSAEYCAYPKTNWEYEEISDHQLCGFSSGKSVCHGDFGGPLIYNRDGQSYLVGISSHVYGKRCVYYGFPALFVRVASYVDWIEESTEEKFCSI